jgi:glucose-6-phosphate isomerase
MPTKSITQSPEFKALQAHQKTLQAAHIKDMFSSDPARAQKFSLEAAGIFIDYSKHKITDETCRLLNALAKARGISEKRDALIEGAKVNHSERRAVLHPALRGSADASLEIDGERVQDFVKAVMVQLAEISHNIRKNPSITDVVHIGIGGSDLGPRLVYGALKDIADGPRIHFVANMDAADIDATLKALKPASTIFIIASKTFTTLETLSNAQIAKAWLQNSLGTQKTVEHIYAVTMNASAAKNFGLSDKHILPLRDWIGGRYSLWSAIGLSLCIAIGYAQFEQLLSGAKDMDTHFRTAPLNQNMPVMMGLLGFWYRNFFDYRAHAILPYAHNLSDLPAYIQQLDMESNGKSVTSAGSPIDYATSPVIFGAIGTNAQHAFFQFLHQGTDIVPCDFIVAATSTSQNQSAHRKLLANALAQAQAMMQGDQNTAEPHRHFDGNRPSSMIVLPRLDPYHLGALLALYEHKTFVQGVLWDINSFDQWGVELGKTGATSLIKSLESAENLPPSVDPSTRALIQRLKS